MDVVVVLGIVVVLVLMVVVVVVVVCGFNRRVVLNDLLSFFVRGLL